MEKKYKCLLSHHHNRPDGGFRVYEAARVYNASELPENPGLPYWEPVEPPAESKKIKGGKK